MIEMSDADVIRASLDDPGRFGENFDRHAAATHRLLGRRVGPDDAGEPVKMMFGSGRDG